MPARGGLYSVPYRQSRVKRTLLEMAAARFIDLESQRKIPRERLDERWIQGVLLGFLEDRIGYMELEYPVDNGRVDFYHKGNPPSAIELAVVRDRKYLPWEHLPDKNRTEIKKLRTMDYPKKLRRFLLLIDLISKKPFEKKKLKESYAEYFKNGGKSCVTVIYVHKEDKFSFAF